MTESSNENRRIEIRKMQASDVSAVSAIIANAFESKMVLLKKWEPERITSLVEDAYMCNPNLWPKHDVITVDGTVAGVIKLKTFDESPAKEGITKTWREIFKEYGFFRVVITGIMMVVIDEPVNRDELYIEYIAVSPEYRGLGLGTKLMDYGLERGKNDEKIRHYTLHVIDKNVRAIHLYERYGFKTVKHISTRVVGKLVGVKGYYHMMMKIN